MSSGGLPWTKSSETRLARAWQRAQVSISRADWRGRLRTALPVAATGAQVTPRRSSSAIASPLPAACACQSPVRLAQATWSDPGPWQASQATSSSAQVVSNVPAAASKFFFSCVEWHSAHMKFQFCPTPVQCSGSPALMFCPGYRWNQRWPPRAFGRESQAIDRACMRPPGSSIRYCCSGRTPNAYRIS